MNSRPDTDFQAKKEDDPNYSKFPMIPTSSRQWSSYKNPRIVRASRTYGGKDRHSKVCTVRGLRDRRIRLSVTTAVQLYDLQDRLGLSQPSKVVDWLIDANKNEIDKLPPLPVLPGNFTQLMHHPVEASHESAVNTQSSMSRFLSSNHPYSKDLITKEGIKMNENHDAVGKDKWIMASHNEQENQDEGFGGFVTQLSAQGLFPLSNQSSFQNFPYNSYFHWDPRNLSLSQSGGGYPFSNQTEDHRSHGSLPMPVLSSCSDLYFCPSAATVSSLIASFPSPCITPPTDSDLRQINHLQHVGQNPFLPTTLNLISSPMKSSALHVNSKAVCSQENEARRSQKDSRKS